MRPRHKKNLDSRLEAVGEYLITLRNDSLNFADAKNENHLLDLQALFGNDNPVHLEIGGGKGTFATTLAEREPDINVLCVEKVRDV
ncbi:MAG: tRNA (guanosine(46)-N7)-methyltransferase TrmB, partial [Eubacterium sp.]|nr:tRNA (guanosine(46)-N7)-methyltransferase TrmB [Eubacterium sp.]